VGALDLSAQRAAGSGQRERAELRVIAVVGAGVVFLDVQFGVADAADRAPRQAAEVDDQVGSDVADIAVDLFRGLSARRGLSRSRTVRWCRSARDPSRS
jgi:hypothetical protein